MKNVRIVTYTNNDKEIVKRGITAIREILLGEEADKKRSLLFCLDWFMLTYYFGTRCAKCLTYDLVSVDDNYKIENPKVMWVS